MVTDRGLAQAQATLADDAVWKAVFDTVDCGLLVLSEPHQVIVEVNSALCELWQIPRQELLGLQLSHVIAEVGEDSDRRSARGRIQRGPAKGSEVEWRQQPLDGATPGTWVAVFADPRAGRQAPDFDQDPITRLP